MARFEEGHISAAFRAAFVKAGRGVRVASQGARGEVPTRGRNSTHKKKSKRKGRANDRKARKNGTERERGGKGGMLRGVDRVEDLKHTHTHTHENQPATAPATKRSSHG